MVGQQQGADHVLDQLVLPLTGGDVPQGEEGAVKLRQPLPELPLLLRGHVAEQVLHVLQLQREDAVLAAVEKQVEDLFHPRPPGGGPANHVLGPLQHEGSLPPQNLNGQGLLAGKEGVKEALGDAQGFVHLFQGSSAVPTAGEQFLTPVQELLRQTFSVLCGVSLFCHGVSLRGQVMVTIV